VLAAPAWSAARGCLPAEHRRQAVKDLALPLAALARVDVLVLDDWGLAILDGERRRDLLELLDERYQTRPTLVTSQLLVADWRDALGDPTLADVILDRLVHHAHALNLAGEPLRTLKPKLTEEPTAA
jgi:DNA replication protein DnaC